MGLAILGSEKMFDRLLVGLIDFSSPNTIFAISGVWILSFAGFFVFNRCVLRIFVRSFFRCIDSWHFLLHGFSSVGDFLRCPEFGFLTFLAFFKRTGLAISA